MRLAIAGGVLLVLHLPGCTPPAPSRLHSFFAKRLADSPNAPAPPHSDLLAVIDTIKASRPEDLEASLPLLSQALQRRTPNLPVEAVFAYFAISRRPDGGKLLRPSVPDLAALLANPDARLSGGAATILQVLTATIPDATIGALTAELGTATAPSLVKAAVVRALLESSHRGHPRVHQAVEAYLGLSAAPAVIIANLQAISLPLASRPEATAPGIAQYALSGLDDPHPGVQVAAIQAVAAMGGAVWEQGRPRIAQLRNDAGAQLRSDAGAKASVREAADRVLRQKRD